MDPKTPPITQQGLSAALGIAPGELKKLRDDHLQPGADWTPGQPVTYSISGVKKIRAALGLPELPEPRHGADADTQAETALTEKTGAQRHVTLTVVMPARGNTRIVVCETAEKKRVNLTVKSNVNFTKGMKLGTCVQRPSSPHVYDFEGRLPRWKGRF